MKKDSQVTKSLVGGVFAEHHLTFYYKYNDYRQNGR